MRNRTRAADYEEMRTKYRPSHADYTYQAKYGIRAWQGGGRASARETIGAGRGRRRRAQAAGRAAGVEIVAYVKQRARRSTRPSIPARSAGSIVEANIVRCPDGAVAEQMIARIEEARKAGDSLGGVVEAVARNVPAGLGEPVFDKLEADLAKAMLSLPACKGFEIGSGFAGTRMTGSRTTTLSTTEAARVRTRTNYSGGVQGGISNGEDDRDSGRLQAHGDDLARAADGRRCREQRPRSKPRST